MNGQRVYRQPVFYPSHFNNQRMINISFSVRPSKKILADRNKSQIQNLFSQITPFKKQQIQNERQFNLNTKDIPGAQPGTKKPYILKNLEKKLQLHNDILQEYEAKFNQKKIDSLKRNNNYFYLNPKNKFQEQKKLQSITTEPKQDLKLNLIKELKNCKQQQRQRHSYSQQTPSYPKSDESQKIAKYLQLLQRKFNQPKEINHSKELGIVNKIKSNNVHLNICQKEKLSNQQSRLKNGDKVEDWKKVAIQMRKMNPSFISSLSNPFNHIQFMK